MVLIIYILVALMVMGIIAGVIRKAVNFAMVVILFVLIAGMLGLSINMNNVIKVDSGKIEYSIGDKEGSINISGLDKVKVYNDTGGKLIEFIGKDGDNNSIKVPDIAWKGFGKRALQKAGIEIEE